MNDQKIKAYHIKVKGRVQGVGFRYFTLSLAKQLHINGWVQNCSDYSVEIVAEANTKIIDEFIYALKNEHPYARVENLTSAEIKVKPYKNFAII